MQMTKLKVTCGPKLWTYMDEEANAMKNIYIENNGYLAAPKEKSLVVDDIAKYNGWNHMVQFNSVCPYVTAAIHAISN